MKTMFGKKRAFTVYCSSCDRVLRQGQKVCACGTATKFMDFAERTQHEVEQWRAYRQRAATG